MVSSTARIAFQGETGANSDFACRDVFPKMEPYPCATFEEVFLALKTSLVDLAMIPIENSLAGRVADIHYLLPASGLHIIGEYFLPINFQLMVLPGVELSEIEEVYSHVHALGQCRNIIQRYGWKAKVAGDTAGAAKLVSEAGKRERAALAPELAAELYNLDIIARDVEDAEHNTTRFVILSRDERIPEKAHHATVMSFVFQVRNVPAALYKAMGGFATNGVNMTKLESYQLDGSFTATQFYAEIDGHPDDLEVQRAFAELEFFSKHITRLGTYPASDFRQKRDML